MKSIPKRLLRGNRVLIHKKLLEKNWKILFHSLPKNVRMLPMIKANAYGHGEKIISKECSSLGAVGIGVADIGEVFSLRKNGFEGLILCFGSLSKNHLPYLDDPQVIYTLHSLDEIQWMKEESQTLRKKFRVHIEIETGMNRLGVKEEEWKRFAQLAQESPGLSVEGIFTHFAESDSIDPGFTQLQLAQFQKAVQQFEKTFQKRLIRHTANSGALLSFPESFFDWVRPGIALYGYPPLSPSTLSKTLHPILEWRALLVQVKNIASGESVGYNRAFRASSPMKIGTIAVGYGDGYQRNYAKVGVGYKKKRCRILGLICMDLMMIDITEIPDAQVGDEVHLIDVSQEGGPCARELAQAIHSIPYEVLTGIHDRVQRMTI